MGRFLKYAEYLINVFANPFGMDTFIEEWELNEGPFKFLKEPDGDNCTDYYFLGIHVIVCRMQFPKRRYSR